jgi:hypothetical protein
MDERQLHNLICILQEKERIEKLETKLTLLQVVKLSIAAIMVKHGNDGFKDLYKNTERELKILYGMQVDVEKFAYKGGKRKIVKF